jgi:hypothetical protein
VAAIRRQRSPHCQDFAVLQTKTNSAEEEDYDRQSSSLHKTLANTTTRSSKIGMATTLQQLKRKYYSTGDIMNISVVQRHLLSIVARLSTVVGTKLSLRLLRPILLSFLVLFGSSGIIAPTSTAAHASSLFGSSSASKSSQEHATTTTTAKVGSILSSSSTSTSLVTNKIVKIIVTAGAVVAGISTAGKVRTTMDDHDNNNTRGRISNMTSNIGRPLEIDDDDNAEEEDNGVDVYAMNEHIANILPPTVNDGNMSSSSSSSSSNDPLSIAWIERELKESEEIMKKVKEEEEQRERMRKLSSSSTTAKTNGDASQLIKNLDAKIDLLSRSSREEEGILPNVTQQQRGGSVMETIITTTAITDEIVTARKEEDVRRAKEWAAAAAAATATTASTDKDEIARKEKARKEKELVENEAIQMASALADEKDEIRVEIGIARQKQKQLDATTHNNNNNGRSSSSSSSHDDSMLLLSDSIAKARQQPKSTEEECILQQKYASIVDLEERAFNILVDLGMVDLNPDPDDLLLSITTLDNIEEEDEFE